MLFALNGFSQKSVQATIFEQGTESPIIGANVLVKGSSTGTVTDLQGKFSISLKQGENVLVFSYVGFAEKEVTVDGQTTIDVYLEEAIKAGASAVNPYAAVGKFYALTILLI